MLEFKPLADLQNIKYFVIHHTGTTTRQSLETIHNWHLKSESGVGRGFAYHRYIRRDGSDYVGRPETKKGAHAGEPANSESLALALEGNFNVEEPTEEQMQKLTEIIKEWFNKYGNKPVEGHEDHGKPTCPGDNFSFEELERRINELDGDDMEKVTINMFGEKIEGILYEGRTYLHVRELEKINFRVDWKDGQTKVTTERSE